ncbi:MAG: hydrogenase nickel incorporation protein HypB [Clostridium sp.]|uniref:hydrogenase nickel incorporation protein HypB n=1 Tax=Clostridium sp. TaxID=1506 RepID=UPI003D6D165B
MDNKKIDVMESILYHNNIIAEKINYTLKQAGIFAINVMGAPGAGKTSVIISMIKELNDLKAYVVEGDIESDIDTRILTSLGIDTIQINTHGACHLDAPTISSVLKEFKMDNPGVMFIENIGNLVCPAEFNIGEDIKMLIVTVTEGSDKPYKYPLAFEKADIIIINKWDLIPYVNFDEEYFMSGVRALNPTALVARVSSTENTGFKEVTEWIRKNTKSLK